MKSKNLKIAGVLLLVLLLIWGFVVFLPEQAAKILPNGELRENVAKIALALIAIIIAWVVFILAIPVLLKIGLLVALGAVVYFAFRSVFKKKETPNGVGDENFKP